MDKLIESLKEVRTNPRKMSTAYLTKHGLLEPINELVPYEDYKIKEKIDIIITNHTVKCHCNRITKVNSNWCSITCRNKDKTIRASISKKNTENSAERIAKAEATRMERYGVRAVQSIPSAQKKTRATRAAYELSERISTFEKYGLDFELLSNHEYLTSICEDSSLFEVQREHFNDLPIMTLYRHFAHIEFNTGFKRGSSSAGEQEMYNWVCSVLPNVEVINNDRSQIGKELDIYIPSKDFAIEYHGVYWHSAKILASKGNGKNHHKEKLQLANSKGIQLLQFFEDEWINKKDIVKSIILSKLGIYEERIYARNCTIEKLTKTVSDTFLEETHLQGKVVGSSYGLFHKGELVAMISVGKSRFENSFELLRFTSKLNTQVLGGFSRLLKYVKGVTNQEHITTYADQRYSNGKLYESMGKFVSETDVGYFWVHPNKLTRINRFVTQKHRLHNLLGDKFNPTLTEDKNMELSGYLKVYDCGNLKYII